MLSLVVIISLAFVIAFFAVQNTATVSVLLGTYVFADVPLYFVILGSMLIGIILSAIIHTINMMLGYASFKRQEYVISSNEKKIASLTESNKHLQKELAKAKVQHHTGVEHTETKEKPSMLDRFRTNVSPA